MFLSRTRIWNSGADSIRTLVESMDAHPEAMACGEIAAPSVGAEGDDGHPIVERTTVIDAVGIGLRRPRRSSTAGQGKEDKAVRRPFGSFRLSGACVMLRASALEALKEADGVWFDDQFFAYKEDVDLPGGCSVSACFLSCRRHRLASSPRARCEAGILWSGPASPCS